MQKKQERLLEVNEARERLLKNLIPLETEKVHINLALSRVLADGLIAPFDFPSFSNSSMDGFAIRSIDATAASSSEPVTLRVIADIPAGSSSTTQIDLGQAARIMTGAMIPPGADAVIPIEDTNVFSRNNLNILPETVSIFRSVNPGEFIRHAGQDVRRGELLLDKGRKLGPAQMGLCAMFGIQEVSLFLKPKVAIIASGNELVTRDDEFLPGKVYDANSLMIASLVYDCGGEPYPMGIVRDDRGSIKDKIDAAVSAGVDLIISSAGVSVGAFDYMRQVIEEYGQIDFWKVNMRPGKPLVSGTYRGIPYMGLPGNPVSAFVGFLVFIEPMIKKMAGLTDPFRKEYTVRLLEEINSDGRQSYLRGFVTQDRGTLVGKLVGHQDSGDIFSLSQANTLLIIPSGVKSVRSGEEVSAWSIVDDNW